MPSTNTRLATTRTAERATPGRLSEDRIFTTTNAVVVLDGASQPDASERNGGWLADTLGRDLAQRLSHDHDDLRRILAAAIISVANRYELQPGAAPSTTVSIVRWNQDVVDVLVLGDSPVIALTLDGELHQVRDDRLRQTARHQRHHAGPGFGLDDRDRWQTSLMPSEAGATGQAATG